MESVLNKNSELYELIEKKQFKGTAGDALAEFAGRVCYASEARFGDAPGFVSDRMAEGHADVIEHGWVSALLPYVPKFRPNRYLSVSVENEWCRVSGNLRAWYDSNAVNTDHGGILHDLLRRASPSVFGSYGQIASPEYGSVNSTDHVQALGWCYAAPSLDEHNHATVLLDGVSRSLTHQLVRHRFASISQRSQRYVDQNKAGWQYVTPPSIANNQEANEVYDACMGTISWTYRKLRDMGVRKEDARFVLPNADTTKLVVSMTFEGWRHFIWLRALDVAAQWEIRAVAQEILVILNEIAPSEWEREMSRLETDKRLKEGF